MLQKESVGMQLNSTSAILSHPLASLVYGTWDDSESNYLADAVFMHPELKKKMHFRQP